MNVHNDKLKDYRFRNKKGFSMIEFIISLALVSILSFTFLKIVNEFSKNQIFISQNDEINKKMESLKLIFEQEQLCSKIVSDNSRRHTLTRSLKDKFSSTHMNEMFQFKKGEHFFSLEGNQIKIIDILLEPESFRINKSSNLVFSKMVTVEFKRMNGAFDGKKVERRFKY